jgi:hypothetical protein
LWQRKEYIDLREELKELRRNAKKDARQFYEKAKEHTLISIISLGFVRLDGYSNRCYRFHYGQYIWHMRFMMALYLVM